MPDVRTALGRYRDGTASGDARNPFRLASFVGDPSSATELEIAWGARSLAEDAQEFWRVCRSARLFVDVDYGQWGLVLLPPLESRTRTDTEIRTRPVDFRSDDIVIGEFLGDQELVVIAPSESGARRILVALPLDPRSDWYAAAESLAHFLIAYFDASGGKYWEDAHA